MTKAKIKTLLFTVFTVTPLAFLYKYFFPETDKLTAFFLILFMIIIFHNIGRFLFLRKKKLDDFKE